MRTVVRPPQETSARFDAVIDRAIAAGPNTEVDYQLDIPKADFLNYVCDWRRLVAHGSPSPDLARLVPKHDPNREKLHEFGRRDLTFASPDGLWAMWFALLPPKDRSTANGCRRVVDELGVTSKRYFFALPAEQFTNGRAILQAGTVYLCRGQEFPEFPERNEKNGEEWGSPSPVVPVARIRIEPADFPFRDGIFGFSSQRLRDLISSSVTGFPWLDDADLYPVRPACVLIDGVTH